MNLRKNVNFSPQALNTLPLFCETQNRQGGGGGVWYERDGYQMFIVTFVASTKAQYLFFSKFRSWSIVRKNLRILLRLSLKGNI